MDHGTIVAALITTASNSRAHQAEQFVPAVPGIYAIFTDSASMLPEPYASRLQARDTTLIYVGKASRSLQIRLVEQDLRHQNPSTFFRGLGAVLGYRPPAGSLVGMKNQNNYGFGTDDTAAIIAWINRSLWLRWVAVDGAALSGAEKHAIRTHRPLLNTLNNPDRMRELARLRERCRDIARN